MSTAEPLITNRALIRQALSLNRTEYKKFKTQHINDPVMNKEHQIWNISSNAAKFLYDAFGNHKAVVAALLMPVERNKIKEIDQSLYSIITAYDKMMDFTVPTKPDASIINNHYKMLIADPLLRGKFSGEDLLSAHFLMFGMMQSTLKKGIPVIELFYRDPLILSQMALSTAKLLNRFQKDLEACQLKDAALNIINPDLYKFAEEHGYNDIPEFVLLKKKDELLAELSNKCTEVFQYQEGFSFEVKGRLKARQSIVDKMEKKKGKKVLDILGLKVIVHCPHGPSQIRALEEALKAAKIDEQKSEIKRLYKESSDQLYYLRSAIYSYAQKNGWIINKKESDNYVAKHKENGYQALHDNYQIKIGNNAITVEIQLLTDQMYHYNNTIASHDEYKGGEGLKGDYAPNETNKMFDEIQNDLSPNVYAFVKEENDISGPYELCPKENSYGMPLDLLSHINSYDSQRFYIYQQGRESLIKSDDRVRNGSVIGGKGKANPGMGRIEKLYGTETGKNAARFNLDSKALKESEILAMERNGKTFLDNLISNGSNGRENGTNGGSNVVFLENHFLDELKYNDIVTAYFYIGKNETFREKLKNEKNKYLLNYTFDAEKGKITFSGHNDSLFVRAIMRYLADTNRSMRSVRQSPDGDKMIFTAELDNFSKEDLMKLTEYLKKTGNVRKLYNNLPAKTVIDKKLKITFKSDEPGMIYKVYLLLCKNSCYISSFESGETAPGTSASADFMVKFPGKFNDEKYKQLLNEIKDLPDAYVKRARLDVTKGVTFEV